MYTSLTMKKTRVKHDELMKILELLEINQKDLCIIKNIYFEQIALVEVEDQTTEDIEVKRGLRPVCVLPLFLSM